jgi:hypothetical protein
MMQFGELGFAKTRTKGLDIDCTKPVGFEKVHSDGKQIGESEV